MEKWQNPNTIILWIIIVIVFFILLLAIIIFLVRIVFQKIVKTKLAESQAKLEHQQNLLETTIITQEKERKRIAEDLHDDLIGKLTVIKLQQEISLQENAKSIQLINESIITVRRISHDLSPPLLEYNSLSDLIKEVLYPWKTRLKIDSFFDIRKEVSNSNEFKIQLIRIVQELITNIVKHADATGIRIHFRQSNNGMILKISDNGVGFDIHNFKNGLGLNNIETRVQYLNGNYRIQSKINEGTSTLLLFKTFKE